MIASNIWSRTCGHYLHKEFYVYPEVYVVYGGQKVGKEGIDYKITQYYKGIFPFVPRLLRIDGEEYQLIWHYKNSSPQTFNPRRFCDYCAEHSKEDTVTTAGVFTGKIVCVYRRLA